MDEKQVPRSTLRELINQSQRIIQDLLEGRISQKEAKLRNKEIKERIKDVESRLRSGGRIVP